MSDMNGTEELLKQADEYLKKCDKFDIDSEEYGIIKALADELKGREWQPAMKDAPRDESVIWVANDYFKELVYWDKDGTRNKFKKQKPNWAKLYGNPELIWKPKTWMATPALPQPPKETK